MHFEENQLSPSSIGISPLSTVHPPRFQPGSVRASTRSYPRFSLTMDRSLGFGSTPCDYRRLRGHALFRLAFATAPGVNPLTSPHRSNSPAHSTKGTQSGIAQSAIALSRLVSTRFQVLLTPRLGCFSPFPHGTSSLSVTKSIQPWTMVRPDSHRIPRVPWYLGALSGGRPSFAYGALTLCGQLFQNCSARRRLCNSLFPRQREPKGPATPRRKRLPAITPSRFRLAPFRSPLLRG